MLDKLIGLPKWAQVLGLVALGIAAFLAWDWFDDRGAIKAHDAKQGAKVTGKVLQAERKAEKNDTTRRVEREAKADALETARDEAIRSQPDETAKPAGPATRAVLGELRRQAAGNINPAR